MKTIITWHRGNADTVSGEQIEVKTLYTSFDKSEIDAIQQYCQKVYGDGLVIGEQDGSTSGTENP